MRARVHGALAIAFGLATGSVAAEEPFPVPRAEAEFRAVVELARSFASDGSTDVAEFRTLVSPFAPLDLEVRRASDPREASLLRNLELGVAGAALGVDAARLANDFHCGADCTARRRAALVSRLPGLRKLVEDARGLATLRLVARFGTDIDLRVNDGFKIGTLAMREALPSPEMGFVPSGQWKDHPDFASFLASQGLETAAVERIGDGLRSADACALVKDDGGRVHIVGTGLGDNTAGLLFQPPTAAPPRPGETRPDGNEYLHVEPIEPGVWFYETS